jgi:hypothetical protein
LQHSNKTYETKAHKNIGFLGTVFRRLRRFKVVWNFAELELAWQVDIGSPIEGA